MAERVGSRAMTFGAGGARSRRIERDEAADASRFFARIAYAVLGLGAPVGVVIHPLALFVIFPIGVALILMSAILEGPAGLIDRVLRAFRIPAFVALVAGLGWAMLSVLWTPYPVSAAQHALKLALLIAATLLAVAAPRDNARATDLYLFPIGVVFGMATMATMGLAHILTGAVDQAGLASGAVALAVLLFPALGGLTARGRNGYARLLLILALVFAYIDGYAPLTVALFAGYLALSFAISDMRRTARELAWGAAAVVLLSPLIPAIAPTVSAWIFHAKLASLPPPYAPLSVAADIFTHHKLRLITGHGFETVSRGVRAAILPPRTPTALAFTVWYELGVIGALVAATGLWFAFRDIGNAPARLAPYMAAGLTAVVALAFLNVDFNDMTAMTLIAVAVIATDVAARSQYRTTRPSAAILANL
ncbi:MAG: hypothetical protein WBQ45_22540 [Roseiarcus sp.]|uniref:hypothetical protein n=1 Tax=Roseiarcus sp. TaxID=1969460 RepID=UPI003C5193E4